MIYNIYTWPFKWFGFWKEYGDDYRNYPSIHDFVDVDINKNYERDKLLMYLRNGKALATTSISAFSLPITGVINRGSVTVRTDGIWLWLDNICDLIENHHLIIPEGLYTHILRNDFLIPEINAEDLEKLEWPGL
jgi:hypothetical protein